MIVFNTPRYAASCAQLRSFTVVQFDVPHNPMFRLLIPTVPIALVLATPLVDQATERLEDTGKPMNLVEYDQPLWVL
jgi:hypothetical protein